MEMLFENKHTKDKQWAKDIFKYVHFRQSIMIVVHVLLALYLIIGICNSIAGGCIDWYFISIPVIWLALNVFLYRRNVNTVIKRDLELHGKPIEDIATVTEDIIKVTQSTGAEYRLNYCDIKKAVQTKEYVYLWSKTNVIFSFKKDSFTCGDPKNFVLFLNNKGIKVKK
jgi:hypothetical protein